MTTRTEKDFQTIVNKTGCTFAKMSRNVFGSELKLHKEQPVLQIKSIFEDFKIFSSNIDRYSYDAFIVGFYQIQYINYIDDLSKLTKNFLWQLSALESSTANANELIEKSDAQNWWYIFQNNRYLPSVFSYLHPNTSARQTFGIPAVFFMFQPIQAFNRRATPIGTEIKEITRQQIRTAHLIKGMPYDNDLMSSTYEGLKVIESIQKNSIVKWWNAELY